MYISQERRVSSFGRSGVQYIPGHIEPFVDYIVENYIPNTGNIVDLGGGGLRFAIPVAMTERNIIVVDGDADSLNIKKIASRVNENGRLSIDLEMIEKRICSFNQEIFEFLKKCEQKFKLITMFRVVHFMSPQEIDELLRLIYQKLEIGGVFVFSSMTSSDLLKTTSSNDIFKNSFNIYPENEYYRKFNETSKAELIKKQQSLPDIFHLVDNNLIHKWAHCSGFEIVESDLRSTRIVAGYILRKVNRL